MSAVSQLHPHGRPPLEQEHQLIGGALNLRVDQGTLAVIGLTGDEFSIAPYQRIWKHVLREVEAGRPVSWQSVAAKAVSSGKFNDYVGNITKDLERLAETSTLDLPAFRLVGAQFKNHHVGQRTAASLRQLAARIETQGLDAAREATTAEAIARELRSRGAAITDLTGDQQRLLTRWRSNSDAGRSDLVTTGIKALDAEIGGLPKTLCAFAGLPSVGKTAFLDSMLHSMLVTPGNEALRIGLVGLEDGVEHVPERWLARQTGYLLREIGNRKLEAADDLRVDEIAAENHLLLQRIEGFRERSIKGSELISLVWRMSDLGVSVVGVDNWNKIILDGYGDHHLLVQRFSEQLTEAAEKAKVVLALVIHLSGAPKQPGGKAGLQGGQAVARDARFRIDFSRKGKALRGTIEKANKLCEEGIVIEFERQATAGLINPDHGALINVEAERRAEKERAEDEGLDRSLRLQAKRQQKLEAKKTAVKVAEVKHDEAQQALGTDDWLLAAGDKRGPRAE